MTEDIKEILNSIKCDDVEVFSALVTSKGRYLSLCFGRLPILSLCYLYKSKKINAEFGDSLAKIYNFLYVEEDYESYKLFASFAKTALRRFVPEGSVVYPLEMLSVLNDSSYLKKIYNKLYKNDKIIANVKAIFTTLHNREVEALNNSILVHGKSKLTKLQKLSVVVICTLIIFMIVFSGTAWWVVDHLKGEGTLANPIKIYGENQLKTAIKTDLYYVIAKDITLTEDWLPVDFSGHIDGRGHKVVGGNFVQDGFVQELKGSMQNIVFVADTLNFEINKSTSFFVDFNYGKISNIHLWVEGELTMPEEKDYTVYIGLLTLENHDEITNCKITTNISCIGKGEADAYFATIASINKGVIYECATNQDSSINTDTVDIGGLVSINDISGTVEKCANNAGLSQVTNKEMWFPQIGGVVMYNLGIVKNCFNYGDIYMHSSAKEVDIDLYAGGIVSINDGEIIRSKNNASVRADADMYHTYVGGIASFNNTQNARIDNCASYGKLQSSSGNKDAYVFVGGIAGCSLGEIKDSFAFNELISLSDSSFLGGIVGCVYTDTAKSINNYYVENNKAELAAASRIYYYYGMPIIEKASPEWGDFGVTVVSEIESLKNVEVYWSE